MLFVILIDCDGGSDGDMMFVYNKGESIKGFDNKLSVIGVMADLVHVKLFDPFAHFF